MTTYTVFGLVDLDADELLVAAVVEGNHLAADSDPHGGRLMRWADHFEAESPELAEQMAKDSM